ncbi:MAG: 2TM domain-containing protein [Lachnospiraceae bacterium]|nr:2TM domain-containing protein [Lachnospiraceae bacterium]
MIKCHRCKVNIVDDSVLCPLCNGILDMGDDFVNAHASVEDLEIYHSKSLMYPDVKPAMRRMKFFVRLFVFFSIVIEAVLILINYLTYNGVKWSLICGAGLIYACFTLIYSFKYNKSHRNKMIVQMVGAIILCILIDMSLGYTGWSLTYAAPSAIMAMDLTIVVLMLINKENWQNYIMSQIGVLLLSILFLILALCDIVEKPLLTIIAVVASVLVLGATVTFGDKKATTELSRRFRV